MKAQKHGQAIAFLVGVSAVAAVLACNTSSICRLGNDADCPPDTFCYGAEKAKAGDKGICVSRFSSQPPLINSFSPLEAAHGAELRIQGANFSTVPSQNSVTLNGVDAEILSATETEITIKVPKNMHCSGPVQVTVGGKTAAADTLFSYVPTVTVSTFAGGDRPGSSNGERSEARFDEPAGIAIDAAGNFYVTEFGGHRIRKITPEGKVSTLAGSTQGSVEEAFNNPWGIAIDKEGNLFVADSENHRIQKITPEGVVRTFAGGGTPGYADGEGSAALFSWPVGIAIDAAGTLYVSDHNNDAIREISPQGNVELLAGYDAGLNAPFGIAIGAEGNLLVADSENPRICRVSPAGRVSILVGSGTPGYVDAEGRTAQFSWVTGIAIDEKTGNLYATDEENHCVRKITPAGKVSTFAGNGTPGYAEGEGSTAQFDEPGGIAIDAAGDLYVADRNNHRIRKIFLE